MKGSPRDGRKISHLSERDRWEMFRGSPDPRLRGHVLAYCDYDERTASFTRRRELPSDRVVLIVNLGAPIRVSPRGEAPLVERPEGFVAGLTDTYALTETRGAQRGLQVDLTPVGARVLLGLPMHELTHRAIGLEEMLGRAGTLRFRRALEQYERADPSGAEIANRCGHYDQAHLIRDFNQFAGGPPGDLAVRRLPDGGGVVGN